MKLYNSLSRSIEEFVPLNSPQVGMYTCGPTVYDFMHIGNLRTFVLSDLLLRTLKFNNYKVKAVENITDIDDKIIARANEKGTSVSEIADEFTKFFIQDASRLNISVDEIISPKATEYIPQMIDYIEDLIEKGFAYEQDSSVYFDISKFENYGKLSGVESRELKTGTRSLSDNYEKDDVQDFALWKKDSENGVESPWGLGRPGWHIECSVMSQENLGDTFDIHVGGIDLLFPHHENEIAQSEAKTGEKFANYFVHGAHLFVDGKKMSKSLGNFYTLKDLKEKGFEPLALRYLYFQTHYRQEMNFTWESLQASQNALIKLRNEVTDEKNGIISAQWERKFLNAINDDLNMPQALAIVWEMLKSDVLPEDKVATLLAMDKVLGLGLGEKPEKEKIEIPAKVLELVHEREKYRKDRRYEQADQRRNTIRKMGFDIVDKEDGTWEIIKL